MITPKVKSKIRTVDSMVRTVAMLKEKGKTIVQCHGVFDIVHLGHIRHFNLAKKEGDVLVVTLTRDKYVKRGPGRPIFNESLRAETLASLDVTDYVCVVDSPTATDFIRAVKPDVYAKGSEYKARDKDVTGKIYEEEDAVKSVGGRIAFTDDITFSSSKIINDYLDVYPQRTVRYLKAMAKRYPTQGIIDRMKELEKLKVLVIGDTIIDEYHYCMPMGKSAKEHLVVNKYVSQEMFAGGTLATANNLASVCGKVDLVTLLGSKDSKEDFIRSKLSPNIKPMFIRRPDAGTIVKRRYVFQESNRKLFEVCFMKDSDIARREETRIINLLDKRITDYDLVVIADFGHGLLTERVRNFLCDKGKYIALNVQTNSANIGFNLVTKYRRANFVSIDQMELRFAAHDKFSDLRALTKKVYGQVGCDVMMATLGPQGSLCYSQSHGFHETPAFAYRVVDSIGAGDAFFAYAAPCFAAGMPQELVSFIGNAVGSLAVQIVCNREPVEFADLCKFITRLLKY